MTHALRAAAALLLFGAAPALAQDGALTEAHLAAVDIDADGSVSKTEYRIFMSDVFLLVDADYDGRVSAEDLADLITAEQFAATDADGDGAVTWAELDAQTLRDFDAADQDGNGSLD
jgi:hypothetical protein